jgi:hypothetical protein
MFDGINTTAVRSWTCLLDQTNSIDAGNRSILVKTERNNRYDPNELLIQPSIDHYASISDSTRDINQKAVEYPNPTYPK